jgi:hypothetical protein
LVVGPLDRLALPHHHPEIGITLAAAPAGLVPTYSGDHWIRLYDDKRRLLSYTLVSAPEFVHGVVVSDISEFEDAVHAYGDGDYLGGGEVDTALGRASWAAGFFSEDGEGVEQVLLFTPHPSGSGRLIVTSRCPPGTASVDERLAVMQELLANVS